MIETEPMTMADYRPFEAHYYNPSKVNFDEVIAPPYDVISPKEQQALYDRSPYNVIRLILNKEEAGDKDRNNRYTRARDFFHHWRQNQILIREEKPCFYLYRQIFDHPESGKKLARFALLGIVKLEPFEKGIVVAHEKTLAKPKADRRRLLEMTKTNFSPVFGLYEDEAGYLQSLLTNMSAQKPFFNAAGAEGVSHEMWRITESPVIHRIQEFLGQKNIYIADGHHRYQTALDYAQEMRRRERIPEDILRPYDFALMALVRFEEEGLVLLPTHRTVKPFAGWDSKKLLENLKQFFRVENLKRSDPEVRGQTPTGFDLILQDGSNYRLTLENLDKAKSQMPAGKPEIWYSLDVNLLAHLVFHQLMGLAPESWESHLQFTHSEKEAKEWVGRGEAVCAFLLRAPEVKILKQMGEVKELMPQKSTYFYPKLASGLVFYQHSN